MDVEEVADELYSASPDEFVERRQQWVAQARAAKDRPLVKAVTALRRPTRSAWLVNLLVRDAAADVAALLELGAALADAQRRGAGPDLRRLSRDRHTALEGLTRRAVQLGAEQGHVATDATRQEVSQTLQAGMADPSVAELLRIGRVVQPASYGGFGPMDLSAGTPTEAAATGPALVVQQPAPREDEPAAEPTAAEREAERARRDAEERAQAAAETLTTAREQATDAAQAADEATAHADELAERVSDLRAQLADAEAEEREAGERARAARKTHQEAQQRLRAAERVAADAGVPTAAAPP